MGTKTSRLMAAAGQERKTRRRMLMLPGELGLVIRWPGRRVQERLRAAGSESTGSGGGSIFTCGQKRKVLKRCREKE